jgi:aspartate racemase
VRERVGGVASADLLIRSFNFADIQQLQEAGRWDDAAQLLASAASHLEAAGAEAILICANTMHRVAEHVQAAVTIPLIHIADATATAVRAERLTSVAVLGTRYTMEQDFYVGRLREAHGLTVLVPDEPDRTAVHNVIYDELVRGVTSGQSRQLYVDVISRLQGRGAEGVIAACTEIELLIGPQDVPMPFFPTARLHALAAVDFALGDGY